MIMLCIEMCQSVCGKQKKFGWAVAPTGLRRNGRECAAVFDSPVYRIFGDLIFVTGLGVLGADVCNGFWGPLTPKIISVFVYLVRISRYRVYVLQFFGKR